MYLKNGLPVIIVLSQMSVTISVTKLLFRSADCVHNTKHLENFNMSIINNTMNLDLIVVRTIKDGFKANLNFQLRLTNSETYQSLFTHKVDMCSMVRSLRNSMFKKWFSSLLKFGNFMDNCPVVPGRYYLNGWYLDQKLIPAYLYPGDYRIRGHGFYGKFNTSKMDLVAQCDLYASIKNE